MTFENSTNQRFRTTQWTQIRALAAGDEREREQAVEALVERYWPPVYAHLRGRGLSFQEAADLTQEFFTQVVLGRELFGRADRGKGRLRTLLLTALQRFVVDQHRRRVVRGAERTISMEALRQEEARRATSTARELPWSYEHRWALAVLEEATRRAETHFRDAGKDAHWALFERWILDPARAGGRPPSFEAIAEEAGFGSAAQASSALQVVKIRVKALVHEVVGETVEDPAEVDGEVETLKSRLTS